MARGRQRERRLDGRDHALQCARVLARLPSTFVRKTGTCGTQH